MGKFVIKDAKNGVKFDLKANNGEIIATSQVYASYATAKNGVESVRKNAPLAEIEDQTAPGFTRVKNPKFEVYNDKRGQVRFRLKATNGQIIATSEGYTEKKSALQGLESIKRNCGQAEVVKG